MHLFRSEEHIGNWPQFLKGTEEGILPVQDIFSIVSTPRHSKRFSGHYISSIGEYGPLFLKNLKKVTKGSLFWDPQAKL